MKEFLNEKGIFIDVEIYSSTGNKYRLSELLTEYAQTLQLLQCDVSGCKTIRHCRECNKEINCDKDFCSQKCQTAYFR
jgi:hypothetical protein